MSSESEKSKQITTEHVVIVMLAACRAAATSKLKGLGDGHSHFVMMKLHEAIKEGEQWLSE